MERFNIVNGDATTAGGCVIAVQTHAENMGENLAMIGDEVFCKTCETVGYIAPDGPRLPDIFMGREVALDGDFCICKCEPKPRLLNSTTNLSQHMTAEEVVAQGYGSWVGDKEASLEKTIASTLGMVHVETDDEKKLTLNHRAATRQFIIESIKQQQVDFYKRSDWGAKKEKSVGIEYDWGYTKSICR